MNPKNNHSKSKESSAKALAQKASAIRRKTIQNLDNYLVEFETAYLKGRGKLYWCFDENEAFQTIVRIIDGTISNHIFFRETPLLQELKLKQQLQGKQHLKISEKDFTGAKIFISGLTFLTCDFPAAYFNGKGTSNQITESETPTILIASIDQLLPSLVDLYAMAPIVSKNLSNTFEIVSLLVNSNLHLLMVDNGRSALLGKMPQNQLLEAAHPINFLHKKVSKESVIEKLYYGHLGKNSIADIIDGFCIDGYANKELLLSLPINEIIIAARELKAQADKSESDIIWRTWKSAMMNRKILNRSSFGPISLMKSFYKRGFGNLRSFPKTSKTNFSERWVKERPDVIESRKLTDIPKGQLLVRRPATDGLD